MTALHRRDVVVGGGLAASLVGIAHAGAAATHPRPAGDYDLATPDGLPQPGEILRRIQLVGSAEQRLTSRLASARCPASAQPPSDSRPLRSVEGQSFACFGLDGKPLAYGLRFVCDPRQRNRLEVAGSPLIARRFAFSVDLVNWLPSFGEPPCTSYCPRFDYLSGSVYPEAKRHQLVPMLLGQRYFTGCQSQDICEADDAGPICFDVNASHPEEARGHYLVTIWSWS